MVLGSSRWGVQRGKLLLTSSILSFWIRFVSLDWSVTSGLATPAWCIFWLHGQLLAPTDRMKQTGNTSGESLQLANSQSVVLWPLALSSLPNGEDELAEQIGLPGRWAPCTSRGQSADPCHGWPWDLPHGLQESLVPGRRLYAKGPSLLASAVLLTSPPNLLCSLSILFSHLIILDSSCLLSCVPRWCESWSGKALGQLLGVQTISVLCATILTRCWHCW